MAFDQEDGWQLVRRGRRGRPRDRTYDLRPQQHGQAWSSWDRGGREAGGGARAFPDPHRGGRANPLPNQPVPPFGASSFSRPPPLPPRSWGPLTRSYADVTRPANPGGFLNNRDFEQGSLKGKRGRDLQSRGEARYIPASPKFGRLARQIKKVIKIVHHLQNVTEDSGKPQPLMIARMVEVLATVIKPAAPKAKTVDMILGNAKNWGYTSMVILQDHYEEALDEALKDLTPDPSLRWKEVFEVATRWAIKNLPRLPREVVDHAEALVAAALEPMPQDRQTNTGGLTDEPEQPTLGRQTQEEVESLEEVVVPPGRGKQTQGPPRTRDGSSQVDPQDGPPAPQMTAAVPLDRGQETTIRTDQQTQTGVITRGKGRQNRQEHPEIKELEDGEHVAPPVLPEPPKERRGNRGRQTVSEPRAEGGQPAGDVSLAGPPPREITRQTQVPLGPIEDDPFAAYPWEKNVTEDSGKPQPLMIARMVEVLATVIKPAAPKAKTVDMILGNAKNWGYTSMVILQDHYEEALDEALKDLTPDPSLRWKEVFEVATRWAIKNLPRLPREVVDHAEALVAAALEPMPQDRQTNTGGLTDEPEQPTLGRQTQEEVESLEEVVVPPGRGKQTQGPSQD
ncbi:hypothetical protein GBF38_008355 [Nibea albiflora]|uniref:Uncharacterized protein n=1 Tax=Nibea albiflora TaxID=240163 RepID=A0ACB7EZ73_NIBAL|nr:hypothetical protein GBF38_008355 [Nibea albiflora]